MLHLNHVLSTWEAVLVQLRRSSISWQGIPLSDRDQDTITEAIVMCSLHLIDMSHQHGGIGSEREIIGWAHNCASLDVHDLGSFLSDVVTLLRNVESATSYNWFKRQLRTEYPFVGKFCAPIRGVLSSFLESPNPRDFRVCYQFFSFLTHISLVDLAIDLETEYEEHEAYLQSLHYPESLIGELNLIMRDWMKDFSISEENFVPFHGPGATAELTVAATPLEKYRYLGTDALTSYVFSKFAGIDVTTFFPIGSIELVRKSVLVFVPKSMKTRRSISKEPGALMYLQQGVHHVLKKFLRTHPFLRDHIDLADQEKNASLAIQSSADQKFATIDLSAASDTVTTRLVKAVFHGTPLYPFLVALRSHTVKLPSGKEIVVEKFAPMGSALCFPIQTLLFSCIVEFAVRRAQRTYLGFFPRWRVYGDDIIVADALYGDVQLVLETLGFQLNESKSYHGTKRFRESCGAHGFDGVDVTPMKISRKFKSVRGRITSHHAPDFERLIDMANTAYVYQFSLLRAWIIRGLLENPIAPPLFSGTGDGALYSPWPDNYRAASRMNWDRAVRLVSRSSYQRREIQVVVSRPSDLKRSYGPDLEQARYYETLRLTRNREGDMFHPDHRIQVSRGSGRSVLRKAWVPDPKGSLGSTPPRVSPRSGCCSAMQR